MSDWEPAARNAYKQIYPNMKLYGCWVSLNSADMAKTQKLDVSESFRNNPEVTRFIRQLMDISFLPPSLISPTFSYLQMRSLENLEMILNLTNLKIFF